MSVHKTTDGHGPYYDWYRMFIVSVDIQIYRKLLLFYIREQAGFVFHLCVHVHVAEKTCFL